ncbi:MAG: gliding motility-associated C-terminal domain-containing protein, partial [Bacteroidales bacterium]|nr:gliding motility-associated C-terminal domain-containing protein [Bacteroidales bacterium]
NNKDISLFDIDNFLITVLAPAPDSLTSTATSTEIELHWKASECGEVAGYYLYRREAGELFVPDSCEYGVPGYTGYSKIATLDGRENTFFVDDNNSEGLVQGISYCYIVTAFYADGSESYASERTCNSLVPGFPSLLNTSVTTIDAISGSIFLSWAKPRNFDTVEAPGPYVFIIYRSEIPDPTGYVVIDSVLTADLNDTTYTDTLLNTVRYPYYYQVKMFNNTPGNRFEMRPGESEIASSLYIDIIPEDNQLTLNIRKKAPWINSEYVVYRKYNTVDYIPVDTISTNQYIDAGLKNGETYYYQVQSFGWRPVDGVEFTNANWSHENFATPVDNTPPCPPHLTVRSLCDSLVNILTWTNPNNSCANDVVRYIVYFSPTMDTEMDSIASTSPATDTTFRHYPIDGISLAGCYAVSAVDSFGNESARSAYFCVDECPLYQLPNVFTPNNDNVNDIYRSLNLNNVIKQVNMKIFNRYGQLVYETTDPDINWKGEGASGVYYYICDVYEPRISGIEVRALSGFIHVYAEGRNENFTK